MDHRLALTYIDRPQWGKKFFLLLAEYQAAQRLLSEIERKGHHPGLVPHVLEIFVYTRTYAVGISQEKATEAANTTKELIQTLGRVQELAKRRYPGCGDFALELRFGFSKWQLQNAISQLLPLAKKQCTMCRKRASAKGKLRNERPLQFLCLFVRNLTGKPHYSEIATLVNTAYQAQERKQPDVLSREALRKIIDRFPEDNPDDYGKITREVRNLMSEPLEEDRELDSEE